MPQQVVLPAGFRDAKYGIVTMAVLGEILQGGLMFGWPSLSGMLAALGNYSDDCPEAQDPNTQCNSQESHLAVLWTVGIFALNCGPVIMGFVLDYLGPKFTAILGVFLNMLGLILFGVSSTNSGPNAFIPAAMILGLGNITFHLAQFHISALFPRHRGLVSSILVAGFTGCAIMMYFLSLIWEGAGSTTGAFQGVMLGYCGVCALWIPMLAWMMPNDSFKVGMVYLMRKDWRFEVRNRSELDRLYRRTTSLQDFVAASSAMQSARGSGPAAGAAKSLTHRGRSIEMASGEHPRSGLVSTHVPDSSDPIWAEAEAQRQQRQPHEHASDGAATPLTLPINGLQAAAGSSSRRAISADGEPSTENGHAASTPGPPAAGAADAEIGPESMPLPSDVVWGPLVFEARRFVELRKRSFKEQFYSSESFGMGVFYTTNVFFMQFYLGTVRLQLNNKAGSPGGAAAYVDFANIVVAFAWVTIPIIGWLLDKKGYGITLGSINALAVLTSVLQALPLLQIQVLTLVSWMVARYFMYSSYFAIFGALFGFRNFGRLVAIDNTFNGLVGLLQFPLTSLGLHALDGNFTAINVAQVILLIPLFIFCYFMYKWEREDLVPIRPMEGEELPVDLVGPRNKKTLHLPDLHLPQLPAMHWPGSAQRGERQQLNAEPPLRQEPSSP